MRSCADQTNAARLQREALERMTQERLWPETQWHRAMRLALSNEPPRGPVIDGEFTVVDDGRD